MDINTLKAKIEYFSYMAKNWKDEDVVVIEKDVVLELLQQVKNNDSLHSVRVSCLKEAWNKWQELDDDTVFGEWLYKQGHES
jgi:hypothetical protein